MNTLNISYNFIVVACMTTAFLGLADGLRLKGRTRKHSPKLHIWRMFPSGEDVDDDLIHKLSKIH